MYTAEDLKDLTPVDGCATDHGYWMRATGPGAARVANQISGHMIGLYIEKRFNEERVARFFEEFPDGKLPEYYMLVDDPAAPTISHVSLGAPKGHLWGVTKLMGLPLHGFAGGYHTKFGAPPEMKPPMRNLADVEGLALDWDFTGETTATRWTISHENHHWDDAVVAIRDERGRYFQLFCEEDRDLIERGTIRSFEDPVSVGAYLTRLGYLTEGASYFEDPSRGTSGPDTLSP